MVSATEILTLIRDLVPYFSGVKNAELMYEVDKFVQGCKLLQQELGNSDMDKIVRYVKQRLSGNAYRQLGKEDFSNLDELCEAVKSKFCSQRTLFEIRLELGNCRPKEGESPSLFAGRLKELLFEASEAIRRECAIVSNRGIFESECEELAAKSFISGLKDSAVQQTCLAHKSEGLTKLVKIAEETNSWLRRSSHEHEPVRVNSCSSENPAKLVNCAFCSQVGHTWSECLERLNTPYCEKCGVHGHTVGPKCNDGESRVMTIASEGCLFCKKIGHNMEVCRDRISNLFCHTCGVAGHVEK